MTRRRGFTLPEMLLVLLLMAGLLALAVVNLHPARDKASSRALAHKLAAQLGLARQQALSTGMPVALAFPSQNASNPVSQSCYLLQGEVQPRIVRVQDYGRESPGTVIFSGLWPLDGGGSPALGGTAPGTHGQRFALAAWQPPNPQDWMVAFTPGGNAVGNLPRFDDAYHLVVAQGVQFGAASLGGQPTFQLSGAREPWTVRVATTGEVTALPGIMQGSGVTQLASSPANAPAPPQPFLGVGPNQNPGPPTVRIEPAPNPATLPPGVDALLPINSFLSLETRCDSPDGDPLFTSWSCSSGQFSHAGPSAMEWDARAGQWVSHWVWTPPPGDPGTGAYDLTVTVTDARGGTSTATFGVAGKVASKPTDKLAYDEAVQPPSGATYSALSLCNPDGTENVRLTGPDEKTYLPMWSPDGSRIAYIEFTSSSLKIINRDGTDPHTLVTFAQCNGTIKDFSWKGDGTAIYCMGGGKNLYELLMSDLSVRLISAGQVGDDNSFCSLPVPPFSLFVNDNVSNQLSAIDPSNGTRQVVAGLNSYVGEPEFSRSGTKYTWGSGTGVLSLADYSLVGGVPTLSNVRVIPIPGTNFRHNPVFSPDETAIEFNETDSNGVVSLWRVNLDGTLLGCVRLAPSGDTVDADDACWSLR